MAIELGSPPISSRASFLGTQALSKHSYLSFHAEKTILFLSKSLAYAEYLGPR